ncbi:MAG: CoA-binding protein [Halobacteriota archaeon]|nr:CoA-binding protein [Halobacteriota archaeon]
MMTKKDIVTELEPLFYPRGVAVVGASQSFVKIGTMTLLSTIVGGFEGGIYPVHRKAGKILGLTAYKDFKSLPDDSDLVVVCVPASAVAGVIEDSIDAGIRAAVIISSGFAEVDNEGKKLQDEVLKIARDGGMRFVGPNCMGICNSSVKLYPLMNMMMPMAGNISFVSQSGTLGTMNMLMASTYGVGFNKFVSSGNEADLKTEDLIEYYANDPDTKVVLSFMEGVRDGRRFFEISKEATKKKPFILLKAGRTKAGAKAASSHTGSLAGSDVINEIAFKQAGVITAKCGEEMLDLVKAFSLVSPPKGRKVGILTAGGGSGVLSADACERMGLEVPDLPEEIVEELNQFLPPFWSHGNPIDITASGGIGGAGGADFSAITRCLDSLLQSDDIDSVITMSIDFLDRMETVISNFPPKFKNLSKIAGRVIAPIGGKFTEDLVSICEKYDKPVIAMGGFESNGLLESYGIPSYSDPERAAFAISKLAEYREFLEKQ